MANSWDDFVLIERGPRKARENMSLKVKKDKIVV